MNNKPHFFEKKYKLKKKFDLIFHNFIDCRNNFDYNLVIYTSCTQYELCIINVKS